QLLVATGDTVTAVAPPSPSTFRGTTHVPGADGFGTVSASIGPAGLTAFVVRPDGARYVVRPLEGLVEGAATGLLVAHPAGSAPVSVGPSIAGYTTGSKVVELGIDCDVEYHQANGGTVVATLADVETLVNEVSAIF